MRVAVLKIIGNGVSDFMLFVNEKVALRWVEKNYSPSIANKLRENKRNGIAYLNLESNNMIVKKHPFTMGLSLRMSIVK
jgi:hypothetical protein